MTLAGPPPGASRATVATGLAVGIAAISTAPILVRAAAMPALALAFWRCLAGAALRAPFARVGWARRPDGTPEGAFGPGERTRLLSAGAFLAVHFALFNASLSFTTVASSVTPSMAMVVKPSLRYWASALGLVGAVFPIVISGTTV